MELFYLQLTILAFLLTVGAFLLTVLDSLLTIEAFFAYNGKVCLIRALRDCKQRSLTQKILVSVKFVSAILGPEMAAPIYGRLEKCVPSAGKTHVHKIPRFRVFSFWGGGGEVPILFLWARGFSD